MLVGFDGSERSTRALKVACALAMKHHSGLFVVTVFPLPALASAGQAMAIVPARSMERHIQKSTEELVRQAVATAQSEGIEAIGEALGATSPVQAITDYALRNHIDLIVVGGQNLAWFKRLLVEGVPNGVATHAPCPVLIV